MKHFRLDYASAFGGWTTFEYYDRKSAAVTVARDLAVRFPAWTYRVVDQFDVLPSVIIKGGSTCLFTASVVLAE